jgi:G:T-mismatch repair DNA endonuclease (very short patch repair protein)
LAVLAPIIFPVHKKARHNSLNNYSTVNRQTSLFPCPLKVPNIVLAMNLIVFYRTCGWSKSIMLLKIGKSDFWLDNKQRNVKSVEVNQ